MNTMNKWRALVVEDDKGWQEVLIKSLKQFGNVQIDNAYTFEEGLYKIKNNIYNLAIVDLNLDAQGSNDHMDPVERGMNLLHELRHDPYNKDTGVIVLTNYGNVSSTKQAYSRYKVDDFMQKDEFDSGLFIEACRQTILKSQLRRANIRDDERHRVIITFNQDYIVSIEIEGPEGQSRYVAEQSQKLDIEDLIRRADNLNLLINASEPEIWREELRSIGKALFQALSLDRQFPGSLTKARALARKPSEVWLQFTGPAKGLSIPFELLHDENDYLALSYILTRAVSYTLPNQSRNNKPFSDFINDLIARKEPLRILIIGANCDGKIPGAEEEAKRLAKFMPKALKRIGIASEVTLLSGNRATYNKFIEEISDGRYHILHYAGHGRFDDELPEISGLILRDGANLRLIPASQLNQMFSNAEELRIVYLSCCLGARTATNNNRGDFGGALEAISRAGVSTVVGFRWMVSDQSALLMAQAFYEKLWHTFSPSEAIFQARLSITEQENGRDDETWASPILLMQSG